VYVITSTQVVRLHSMEWVCKCATGGDYGVF
jgi:hypothetical protein